MQTLTALAKLREAGVRLVLITGARMSTLLQRLPFLPAADAFVCENGGCQEEQQACAGTSSGCCSSSVNPTRCRGPFVRHLQVLGVSPLAPGAPLEAILCRLLHHLCHDLLLQMCMQTAAPMIIECMTTSAAPVAGSMSKGSTSAKPNSSGLLDLADLHKARSQKLPLRCGPGQTHCRTCPMTS